MVAALNYSAFRIIFYGVLPVKNRILYRLYLATYIDIMDSILEIKLLTCFFSSVNRIKQYILATTYWCVCARACVCASESVSISYASHCEKARCSHLTGHGSYNISNVLPPRRLILTVCAMNLFTSTSLR